MPRAARASLGANRSPPSSDQRERPSEKWRATVLLGLVLAIGAPPFQILTTHLPLPVAGQPYSVQLRVEGGTPPYQWVLLQGGLPPGLALDVDRGVIAGVPAASAPFAVAVQVTDSSQPPLALTRLLPAAAAAPLALAWTTAPAVTGATLAGAVRAENAAGAAATVTVIVAAVNERGKAFAIRYDHERLADGAATPALAFSEALPPGTYTLHADAVAEVSPGVIYRQRVERPGLSIPTR